MRYPLRAARALLLLGAATLLGVAAVLGTLLWPAAGGEPGLRFSGVFDSGGYRLVIPGSYTQAQAEEIKGLVRARLESVDQRFSPQRAQSEVGRLARAPLGETTPISAALARLIDELYTARALSGGAYPALAPTPLSAWWQPQSPALDWVDRFVWQSPGPSALLAFDDRALPFAPVRLAVDRVIAGIGADALADELDRAGIARYRVEVQGSVRVSGGGWPFALDDGALLSLERAAVASAESRDGGERLVIGECAEAVRLAADSLASLDSAAALALAERQGWAARMVDGAGRVEVSRAFSRLDTERPTARRCARDLQSDL